MTRFARHRRHLPDERFELGHAVAVGRRGVRGQRRARPAACAASGVGRQVSMVPFLTQSVGSFASFVPATQRPQGCGVHRRPAPVDLVGVARLARADPPCQARVGAAVLDHPVSFGAFRALWPAWPPTQSAGRVGPQTDWPGRPLAAPTGL